jgi:hypothetical protein
MSQSLDCNDDGRLKSNREDQFSHRKILRNGRLDVIKDLKECTRSIIITHDKKIELMNSLKLAKDHMISSIVLSLKMKC